MFQFRLQRILELRERREKETATRLTEARDAADAARGAQEALEAIHTQSVRRLATASTGGAPVGELRNVSYVLEHLNRQIQEARSVATAADESVKTLTEEFATAFKDRRMLDLLREKKLDEWKAGKVSSDRQTMDGVALGRFTRQDRIPGKDL